MGKVLIGNFKGPQGDQGIQGEEGKAASIMIDSVQTLQPEENATVENVGTTSDARLKFGIPRGSDGMTDLVARYEDASEYTATPTADAPIVINDLNGITQQGENPSPDNPQMIHGVGDMGFFDGSLQKGYYNTSGVYTSADNYVCTVNKIECKQSDNINVELETSTTSIIVSFFQSSGTFISQRTGSGTSLTATAPANAGYCMISINRTSIEPQTAGHISVTINGKYASRVESRNEDSSKKYTIQFPLTNPLYDGDKVCYVKPGESYINSEGDTVVADRMLYGHYHENGVINSYNSEVISGEYKSSTGELTTGAEVVYKLAQPWFEPFEDQTPFYNLRSFDNITYIYSDDPLNPTLTVDVAKNQTGGYIFEAYNHSLKNQNVYNDMDERINNMLFADYDGKVYSTFFEDSTTSMASTGEKEDDNAGIANPVPSTDTVSNENPYDSIPLFKPIECNGYVDEEGNPHITAIKGSPEFKEDGSNGDVCIALKTGYIRTIVDTDGSILGKKGRKVSVTDTWRESEYPNHPFVPYTGAIRLDGSVRPYILIPKYQAVSFDGSYYSLPGFSPAYNVSHNNQITTFQKRGKQYCGETNSDAEVWETLFEIVFATLNSQSIMSGCTSYSSQHQVTQTESNVKRVIVTNSQAANILIGSCVSIGDKGTNSSVDRGDSYMHSLANRVLVTKKEALSDGANTAIYVDSPNSFTTTATTYISTMPWYTGATNSVKGTCGSPVDNLNGKYPFKFLGIEFALGQYIVRSDVILNGVYDSEADTYRQDIYTCLDCTKFATSITGNYVKLGYSIPDTNVSWQYISDLGFDINNPHVRMAVKYGANSSQRYADGTYTGTRANGTREFLSLGIFSDGSIAGLRFASLNYSLSSTYWYIAARPSYTGRRGTVADWASKNNISIGGVL